MRHSNRIAWMSCIVVAGAVCSAASVASAALIEFIHEGMGSGTLAGQPFGVGAPVAFTITAYGDTNNRVVSSPGAFSIPHDAATIEIAGVGTFDFLVPTRTFVNNNLEVVGFSRLEGGGPSGSDLFNGPEDPALGTWDMLSSIGPIAEDGHLLQWSEDFGFAIETTGGTLFFETGFSPAIFTATILPAPGALALLGMAVLGASRRRRLRDA